MEIVTIDLGGTHARFAIAEVAHGRVAKLHHTVTIKTGHHASLTAAWQEFAATMGKPLPSAAALAVACPVNGHIIKLTNNAWIIEPERLKQDLQLQALTLVNDFGAVGHAVAQMANEDFAHICGPQIPLPQEGVISIIGPGTGLGVAQVLRRGACVHVVETEGGHSDFAPLDAIEDAILARLRERFCRVSVERIASGPGLLYIYEALAALENVPAVFHDIKELWHAALNNHDLLARSALERFCLTLGAVAGDIALTQGAAAVVIAGGVGLRLADFLPQSGFAARFVAKGRFQSLMQAMPVKLITDPQVGLIGAAAAFAQWHT